MKIETGQSSSGWHRLSLYIECPRKFAYREVMRLVPLVLDYPLALGSACHDAAAAELLGMDWRKVLHEAPPRISAAVPKAKEIMTQYFKHYAKERVETLAVEKEVCVTLRGLSFTRRLDHVYRDRGKVKVRDHKTAGSIRTRQRGLDYDPSLFTQVVVGEAVLPEEYGLEWGGLEVNLIGTSAPFKFARPMPFFRKEWMHRVADDLYEWLYEAHEAVESGRDPWTYRRSWQCQGRYRMCEYQGLCLYGRREMSNYTREAA